ncbi:nucleotide-sugar transporter [Metarhizium brunneum]
MAPDPSSPSSHTILSPSSPLAAFDAVQSPISPSSASQFDPRLEFSGAIAPAPTNPSTSRQAVGSGSAGNDIEMEPIPGHRRRKSSLMNPVGGHSLSGVPAPSRPSYSQSSRNNAPTSSSLQEGSKEHLDVPGRSTGESGSKDDSGRDSSSDEDLHDDEEMGLTRKDKSRKQKKRRRNTLLDNRIAREKHVSDDERKEADRNVVRSLFTNGVLILLWYFFSLSISLYNKWMFDKDRLNFAFPLFTTSTHMIVQFVLSGLVLTFVPSLRPKAAHNSDGGRSRHESGPQGSVMSKIFYFTRIGPCGAATSLDIGLGNTSLKFISLTFYTMCKSSSLAFVLLFAFVFRLETPTWRLVAIIATMTFGVILMVFGEVEFKFGGFFLVISAAFFSGLRWALTQILLLRNPATSNPFSSIFFLSPVMFVVLFSLAIPVEGFGPLWDGLKALNAEWGVWTPLFLLFPGCIAFLMIASEFALLQRTSVVTLSIAGIFKEVVTISAASIVFDDKLTSINVIGLLVTMAAIGAYNYVKITKMRQEAQIEVHERHAGVHPITPISHSGSGSDMDNDESAAETAGLLQRTDEQEQGIVTVDGDVQSDLPRPSNAQ